MLYNLETDLYAHPSGDQGLGCLLDAFFAPGARDDVHQGTEGILDGGWGHICR